MRSISNNDDVFPFFDDRVLLTKNCFFSIFSIERGDFLCERESSVSREKREDQDEDEERAEDGADQAQRAVAQRVEEIRAIGGVLLMATICCRSSVCIAPTAHGILR